MSERCKGKEEVEVFPYGMESITVLETRRCYFVAQPGSDLCGKHKFLAENKPAKVELSEQEQVEKMLAKGQAIL